MARRLFTPGTVLGSYGVTYRPVAGFVCMYYGNTGSSWLVETLSTSPEILVTGFEPLEKWAWEAPAEAKLAWMRAALSPPQDTVSEESLAVWAATLSISPQFKGTLGKSGFRLTGWKMTWGSVGDPEGILQVLADTGSKVISLVRENRVKHALSLYRYHEEGKSQFESKGKRPPSEVSAMAMTKWLAESQRLHDQAVRFSHRCEKTLGRQNVAHVAYEDFVTPDGKRATTERLTRFLGVDPERLIQSRFEKATPDDLESALVNYRQLRRKFFFTPYRKYFR
jgi:hypothetical protein